MPRLQWRHHPHGIGHRDERTLDRDTLTDATKALLAEASAGPPWIDPLGERHIPIVIDGETVGSLWEDDVDLTSLEMARYWPAPFGAKVQLAHDGKIIGMMRVHV